MLSGLLAGLLLLERSQAPAAADAHETHRPLVAEAERESLQLAGFALTSAGERHEYRRSGGVWRCVTAFGAVANPRQIADLSSALLTHPAAWRAPLGPEASATFGFDTATRVDFLRSDPDAGSITVELGSFVNSPAGRSVFVRRSGLDGVWELDALPLQPLSQQRSSGFPPLLDQRLTAGCTLDPAQGITRAFIDFHESASLELRPREIDGELRWSLTDETREYMVLPYRFAGWLSFLQRAPYAGFANPGAADVDRGLEPPAARVTLFPPLEAPIELVIGREVSGQVYLQNRTSGMLLLLRPNTSALIAPGVSALSDASIANPWEAWLR
jgi:hypothetical protein